MDPALKSEWDLSAVFPSLAPDSHHVIPDNAITTQSGVNGVHGE